MRKALLITGIVLSVLGAVAALGGGLLGKQYEEFRTHLARPGSLPQIMPRFLPIEERKIAEEFKDLSLLEKAEIQYRRYSSELTKETFRSSPNDALLRKAMREAREKISGTSWRSYASRGQLAVRELLLAQRVKNIEEKELKQLWQYASRAYQEARLQCETITDSVEFRLCVDITTKNYEFLIRPAEKGGLGALTSAPSAEQGDKEAMEIPMIRGKDAGGGSGAFGTR